MALSVLVACAPGDGPSAPQTGSVAIVLQGLPVGVGTRVTIAGASLAPRSFITTGGVEELPAGEYTVTTEPVLVGRARYEPSPAATTVVVTAGQAAASVRVTFQIATGALTLRVVGLPDGSAVSGLAIDGASAFHSAIADGDTIDGLEPGAYIVSGEAASALGHTWEPPADPTIRQVSVTAGLTPTVAELVYSIATGALVVEVDGLPDAEAGPAAAPLTPAISIRGPDDFNRSIQAGEAITDLRPGSYTVEASVVEEGNNIWTPEAAAKEFTLSPGLEPVIVRMHYVISTGGLNIMIDGLPASLSASVLVTGAGGFSQPLTSSTMLARILPGSYQVVASSVGAGTSTYDPTPVSQSVVVPASTDASVISITYALRPPPPPAPGALSVTITGLPGAVAADVSVSGPGGFSRHLGASQGLTGLAAGAYTVTAANVSSGGTSYEPAPGSQTRSVSNGATSSASVTYSPLPAGPALNLSVYGLQVIQAVQTFSGAVPLVAGRDAFLRVFAIAHQANSVAPDVRVRLYAGGLLQQTFVLSTGSASTPTSPDESSLSASWNQALAGASIQPGLSILVDVDPANTITESNELDNSFPASGVPLALDVRSVPDFNVTFVPVKLRYDPVLTGNVTAGNWSAFTADALRMMPLHQFSAQLHAVYTSADSLPLQSNDANNEWTTILSEIRNLRAIEGSTRHYYGVVKTGYSSGIAGYGYLSDHAAIGWDNMPSGSGVAAHEWGHNFGRAHAPCGGAANVDPAYPYPGGTIGVFGYDVSTNTLKSPARPDIMSYCSSKWISDYTYTGILNYRAANPVWLANAPFGGGAGPGPSMRGVGTPASARQRTINVWGRITGGQVQLEPAFTMSAVPVLPSGRGPYRVEALDANGRVLWSFAFEGAEVAHGPSAGSRHFAFVIPLSSSDEQAMVELRVTGSGARPARRMALPLAAGTAGVFPSASVTESAAAGAAGVQASIRWDAAVHPMALIRDRRTGEVLSFARGGQVTVPMSAADLDVSLSDGVRSVHAELRAR